MAKRLIKLFVVELLMRCFIHHGRFFEDPWRMFDRLVVGIAVDPAGSAFAVLPVLRVLRVSRRVSLVPSMRRVIGALLNALPGMTSIFGVMAQSLHSWGFFAVYLLVATFMVLNLSIAVAVNASSHRSQRTSRTRENRTPD